MQSSANEPESHEVKEPSAPKRMSAGVKIGIVVALLGGVVALLLVGSSASDAFVYSQMVDVVMTRPAEFAGRELRVEGLLKSGTIQFREQPCEYRFVIEKAGKEMPVAFPQCVVPDTFRDNMGISVTVQGKLDGKGGFLANQVVPRCPSKYEMQQRKNNGEVMPHAAASATSLSGS